MLLIYGRRTLRIKRYTENQQSCKSCGSFDLDIKVYRDYYHLFFIPFFPVGYKSVKMRCKTCGEPMRVDSIQKHYEELTRTPFYLFAGIILCSILILLLVNSNLNSQKEKIKFVDNPKVGDVYGIRKNENNSTTHYFLRLSQISGDTVFAYHNNLEYHSYISRLNEDDFFVKDDELVFTKKELKRMLESEIINSVEREYGDYEGFDRIK